jgi:hypothetical protein
MFLLALVYRSTRSCWMHHCGGVGISHLIATGGICLGDGPPDMVAYEHQEEVATMPSSRAYADACIA